LDLSDQVLVDKVKNGDYQAFESLVTRYESKVYRLSIRMLRSPQDAEDALQETFSRFTGVCPVLKDVRRFPPGCSAWPPMCA
jgi:RNA polymerase sigma-70 factor (ECF subfamily)